MAATPDWDVVESDPTVFTTLVKLLGVTGLQVEELWTLEKHQFTILRPIHGILFIYKYMYEEAPTGPIVEDCRLNTLYFGKQAVPNICATQALMSVILNCDHPDVKIGHELERIKDFSMGLDTTTRGIVLSQDDYIRHCHNSVAHRAIHTRDRRKTNIKNDDIYHYISFVPFNGRLYEMDGMLDGPVDHGPVIEQDWIDVTRSLIQRKINLYPESEIRFSLMAVVTDRTMVYERLINEMSVLMDGMSLDTEVKRIRGMIIFERDRFEKSQKEMLKRREEVQIGINKVYHTRDVLIQFEMIAEAMPEQDQAGQAQQGVVQQPDLVQPAQVETEHDQIAQPQQEIDHQALQPQQEIDQQALQPQQDNENYQSGVPHQENEQPQQQQLHHLTQNQPVGNNNDINSNNSDNNDNNNGNAIFNVTTKIEPGPSKEECEKDGNNAKSIAGNTSSDEKVVQKKRHKGKASKSSLIKRSKPISNAQASNISNPPSDVQMIEVSKPLGNESETSMVPLTIQIPTPPHDENDDVFVGDGTSFCVMLPRSPDGPAPTPDKLNIKSSSVYAGPNTSPSASCSSACAGPSTSSFSMCAEPSTSSSSMCAGPSTSSSSMCAGPSTSSFPISAEPNTSSSSMRAGPSKSSFPMSAEPSTSSSSMSAGPSTSSSSMRAGSSTSSFSMDAGPSTSSFSMGAEPSTSSSSMRAGPSTSSFPMSAEPSTSSSSMRANPSTSSSSMRAGPSTSSFPMSAEPSTSSSSMRAGPSTSSSSMRAGPSTSSSSMCAGPSTSSSSISAGPSTSASAMRAGPSVDPSSISSTRNYAHPSSGAFPGFPSGPSAVHISRPRPSRGFIRVGISGTFNTINDALQAARVIEPPRGAYRKANKADIDAQPCTSSSAAGKKASGKHKKMSS